MGFLCAGAAESVAVAGLTEKATETVCATWIAGKAFGILDLVDIVTSWGGHCTLSYRGFDEEKQGEREDAVHFVEMMVESWERSRTAKDDIFLMARPRLPDNLIENVPKRKGKATT